MSAYPVSRNYIKIPQTEYRGAVFIHNGALGRPFIGETCVLCAMCGMYQGQGVVGLTIFHRTIYTLFILGRSYTLDMQNLKKSDEGSATCEHLIRSYSTT